MKAQWLASALQKLSRPAGLSTAISAGLIEQIQKSACQNDQGFHGLSHWLRVLQNGRELAKATGANLKVVELFAVIHDSQRRNENTIHSTAIEQLNMQENSAEHGLN